MANVAKFETQRFGSVVATIQESADGAVEVKARNDGKFILTIHRRVGETDRFEDISATLEPMHFEMLGSIAERSPLVAVVIAANPCDKIAVRWGALQLAGRKMIGRCPICKSDGGDIPGRPKRSPFECDAEGWLCAVCCDGGDVIKLVQSVEKLDRDAAVAFLNQKNGV